ncbi:hypothetical protein [Undibacterium fentianense]|uniref:SGNH/GDSL hydrolase family protein n=1 Tax=Undibacterium fentianense TaxID=2828728 RepID=A0A941E2J6_9BURK|nr:hypothetical protein [Undibacterium fentianense]MBR7799484.1 hypothetical protein [Undibacterium fentianense]
MQFLIRILCAISALVLATNLHAFTTLRLPYAQAHSSIKRVLFVGNSLTYVGNIPAVFSTLSSNNGHAVQADMLVQGGATLTDRLKDETLVRAMQTHHYDGIVIQERGGDLIGAFGESAQSDAEFALTSLASIAKNAGMKIFFLGSYQLNPGASRIIDQ